MWQKALLAISIFACVVQIGPPARGAAITVQLYPLTGEVRFTNRGLGSVPIVLYTISSPGKALNGTAWTSITDNYDASGNQLVDPINEWNKLSWSTDELSEGEFMNGGGNLPPMRSISLGRIWNPFKVVVPDLAFEIAEPSDAQVGVTIEYTVDGDYSGNGAVDFTDYNQFWRATYGSGTFLLADGNMNGTVDGADYVVWRKNLGRRASAPPFAAGSSGVAVANLAVAPEPNSMWLFLTAVVTAAGAIARARAQVAARGAARRRAVRR
jgi:hypothetical protein